MAFTAIVSTLVVMTMVSPSLGCLNWMQLFSDIQQSKSCIVRGDPNYSTFDGMYYRYQGHCTYTLSKTVTPTPKPFHVALSNFHKSNPYITYPGDLRVVLPDDYIVLMRNGLSSVDTGMSAPFMATNYNGGSYCLTQWSTIRILQTSLGLNIAYIKFPWQPHGQVIIWAKGAYSNKIDGMCGNMDGNQGETCFANPLLAVSTRPYGDCWLTSGPCHSFGGHHLGRKRRQARPAPDASLCDLMQDSALFGTCAADRSLVQSAVQACNNDISATGESPCEALEGFATLCALHGHTVGSEGWRLRANCHMRCARPLVSTTVPCQSTCEDPHAAENCEVSVPIDSCGCPSGTVLHNNECISPAQCPPTRG